MSVEAQRPTREEVSLNKILKGFGDYENVVRSVMWKVYRTFPGFSQSKDSVRIGEYNLGNAMGEEPSITIVFGDRNDLESPKLRLSMVEINTRDQMAGAWSGTNPKVLDIAFTAKGTVQHGLQGDALSKEHKRLSSAGVSVTTVCRGENDMLTTVGMRIGAPIKERTIRDTRLMPFVETVGKMNIPGIVK